MDVLFPPPHSGQQYAHSADICRSLSVCTVTSETHLAIEPLYRATVSYFLYAYSHEGIRELLRRLEIPEKSCIKSCWLAQTLSGYNIILNNYFHLDDTWGRNPQFEEQWRKRLFPTLYRLPSNDWMKNSPVIMHRYDHVFRPRFYT
jgi:hypothetical protein